MVGDTSRFVRLSSFRFWLSLTTESEVWTHVCRRCQLLEILCIYKLPPVFCFINPLCMTQTFPCVHGWKYLNNNDSSCRWAPENKPEWSSDQTNTWSAEIAIRNCWAYPELFGMTLGTNLCRSITVLLTQHCRITQYVSPLLISHQVMHGLLWNPVGRLHQGRCMFWNITWFPLPSLPLPPPFPKIIFKIIVSGLILSSVIIQWNPHEGKIITHVGPPPPGLVQSSHMYTLGPPLPTVTYFWGRVYTMHLQLHILRHVHSNSFHPLRHSMAQDLLA